MGDGRCDDEATAAAGFGFKVKGGGVVGRREYGTKCGSNEVTNSLHNENRKWKVNVIQHPLQHRTATATG